MSDADRRREAIERKLDALAKPITPEIIREQLERGAERAAKLYKLLNDAHLRGYSRSMSLRLD